jgi:tetratricopeptide (TPR) repeat protein
VNLDETYLPAVRLLGDAYLATGATNAADTWYKRAYAGGAADPVICYRIASQAIRAADYDLMEEALRRGLEVAPEDVALNDALARLYALCPYAVYRNGAEAVRVARKVHGDDDAAISVRGLTTLAAAYAEADDFAKAVHLMELAIAKAQEAGDDAEANRLEAFLGLYRQNKRVYDIGS